MAAKLIVAPEAELDITEAYIWYESRRVTKKCATASPIYTDHQVLRNRHGGSSGLVVAVAPVRIR